MTTQPTVLILGANGRFGLAAAQAFDAAGWRVLAQARRGLTAGMPAAAIAVNAPIDDTEAIVRTARTATVVVHALNPVYTRWATDVMPMARAGMAIAERLGATFMLPGNVYNFGADMPALLTEATPERPTTDKGEIRRAMEAEMTARASTGLRSIVVRAGDFYGGGSGNWMDMVVIKSLAKGKLVYPGALDVPHAWAYLPDFARCFVALAERRDLPMASRFHFAGNTLTGQTLLAAIERAASMQGLIPERFKASGLRRGHLPWGVIRAVAWGVPMWGELVKMSYLWRVPHGLAGDTLARTIGDVPATPLDTALRATLQAWAESAPTTKPLPEHADAGRSKSNAVPALPSR